jgi:hypothetical protein
MHGSLTETLRALGEEAEEGDAEMKEIPEVKAALEVVVKVVMVVEEEEGIQVVGSTGVDIVVEMAAQGEVK